MAERADYYGEKLHQPEDDITEEVYGELLPIKQGQFIAALITHPTFKKAYNSLGLPYRTVKQWLEDPAFARAYKAARDDIQETAKRRIMGYMDEAVEVLHGELKSESATARLKSAELILDFGLRFIEVEQFQERIVAIEKAVNQLPAPPS